MSCRRLLPAIFEMARKILIQIKFDYQSACLRLLAVSHLLITSFRMN
jgi:hypothetical protein